VSGVVIEVVEELAKGNPITTEDLFFMIFTGLVFGFFSVFFDQDY